MLALTAARAEPRFTDMTRQAGVDFRNWFGDDNTKTILETTGTGAAFCDFDGDGFLDLYIVNGAVVFDSPRYRDLPRQTQPQASGTPRNGLFRNNGDGTFTEGAVAAGVGHSGWGQGCACADYDNDGDQDLYITYYGANVLYRNEGDSTFAEVGAAAGVDSDRYSTAMAFADYNGDGLVDLFVGNYVDFDPQTAVLPGEGHWGTTRGIPTSPPPEAFAGQPDLLYKNRGDGTFAEVSAAVGLNQVLGKALGAVFFDYDNDGDQDLFVANDAMANFLYTNNGSGIFSEDALMMGVAYGGGGVAEGSMGVAVADYDGDGLQDLVVANYEGQTATLYRNAHGFFYDAAAEAGLYRNTLIPLQWGAIFFDYDNDGDPDLFLANGHITSALESQYPQSKYARKNQLFRNDRGRFAEVTDTAGEGMQVAKSSRGAIAGDYDNDGDLDLFVVNKNDFPSLLHNDGGHERHWLQVRLRGATGNRDGIGAQVRLVAGGQQQIGEVRAGSSYLSHNSIWLAFGLGDSAVADTLEIRWPGGRIERFVGVEGDRAVIVEEGRGMVEAGR